MYRTILRKLFVQQIKVSRSIYLHSRSMSSFSNSIEKQYFINFTNCVIGVSNNWTGSQSYHFFRLVLFSLFNRWNLIQFLRLNKVNITLKFTSNSAAKRVWIVGKPRCKMSWKCILNSNKLTPKIICFPNIFKTMLIGN